MGFEVSDFSLLRLNLIEKGLLKEIEQNKTYDIMTKLVNVEDEIRNFPTESMIEELFNIIPMIDDTIIRRMTLKIKRNLYNINSNNFIHVSRLEPYISKIFLEKYDRLQELCLLKDKYYEEVECIYNNEIAEGNKFLIGLLDNKFFSSALVLSSPSFGEHVYNNKKKYSNKVISTLSSYFTRATLKTSPFSYYTVLGMNYFNESIKIDKNKLVINKLNNNIQINQGILNLIIEGMAENVELSDLFTYEINQGLILRNEDINLLSYKNNITNGFYGKYEYLNKVKYYEIYTKIVEKGIGKLNEWSEIASDYFPDERKAIQKLIVNKILRPVIPFCITDGDFLVNLIKIIDQNSSGISKDLVKELTAVKEIVENFEKKNW
ncbi:hypothetical protein [Bacillus sp. JCM 19041]|uniref:hypothetical protein n=1 Tax=Bacillus sp. JCM 19041 TaxID=1460637 RepID=UPI0006D173D7